jgi:CheY-like chemotaxis protein/HPt (histidine-containing phosphotransfer) domain-containing protein
MVEQDSQRTGGLNASGTQLSLTRVDGSKPRLLLAEDSSTARILTAALLERMGADVDAVEHGEEALDQVRQTHYDLVLLDIEMPVMDGVSAAKEIRALDGLAGKTPLMALSAFLADSAKCGSWREAFDHALPKPAGRAELHSAIQSVLNSTGLSLEMPDGSKRPDRRALIDRLAMAEARGQVPAESWSDLVCVAIDEIQDCVRNIEITLERNDRGEMKRQAHKLHGIARSFAAPKLAAAAAAYERDSETSSIKHLGTKTIELRRIANRTATTLAALNAN